MFAARKWRFGWSRVVIALSGAAFLAGLVAPGLERRLRWARRRERMIEVLTRRKIEVSWEGNPVIIGKGSPMRRLPSAIPVPQVIYLDGIRFSIELADLAYNRLLAALETISRTESLPDGAPVSCILDAWSIVDSGHRLLELIAAAPGLKGRDNWPTVRKLRRHADSLEALRNKIQHLRKEILKLAEQKWTAWGVLNWVYTTEDPTFCRVFALMPGRADAGQRPLLNPAGRTLRIPIDAMTLTLSDSSVCLSEFIRDVAEFTASFEASLNAQIAELPDKSHPPSDGLLSMLVEFGESGNGKNPKPPAEG